MLSEKLEVLLDVENHYCNAILQWAAEHNTDSLKLLIKVFGEKVLEVKDENGNTVLHFSAKNKDSIQLLMDLFGEKVESLIQTENKNGNTTLHFAAWYNKRFTATLDR